MYVFPCEITSVLQLHVGNCIKELLKEEASLDCTLQWPVAQYRLVSDWHLKNLPFIQLIMKKREKATVVPVKVIIVK